MDNTIDVKLKGKKIYKDGSYYGEISGHRWTDGKRFYSTFKFMKADGSTKDFSHESYFKDVVNRIKWEVKNNLL